MSRPVLMTARCGLVPLTADDDLAALSVEPYVHDRLRAHLDRGWRVELAGGDGTLCGVGGLYPLSTQTEICVYLVKSCQGYGLGREVAGTLVDYFFGLGLGNRLVARSATEPAARCLRALEFVPMGTLGDVTVWTLGAVPLGH